MWQDLGAEPPKFGISDSRRPKHVLMGSVGRRNTHRGSSGPATGVRIGCTKLCCTTDTEESNIIYVCFVYTMAKDCGVNCVNSLDYTVYRL